MSRVPALKRTRTVLWWCLVQVHACGYGVLIGELFLICHHHWVWSKFEPIFLPQQPLPFASQINSVLTQSDVGYIQWVKYTLLPDIWLICRGRGMGGSGLLLVSIAWRAFVCPRSFYSLLRRRHPFPPVNYRLQHHSPQEERHRYHKTAHSNHLSSSLVEILTRWCNTHRARHNIMCRHMSDL